jgi:hypothetical protein
MASAVKRLQTVGSTSTRIAEGSHTVPLHLPAPNTVISAPGTLERSSFAIVDGVHSDAPSRSIIRVPSSISHLGNMYVSCTLAAAGGVYRHYVGLNLIRAYRVYSGGELICDVQNARAALKTALRFQPAAVGDGVLEALGGATATPPGLSVAIPLLVPWGTLGHREGVEMQFLPLYRCPNAVLTVEIDWNLSSATMSVPVGGTNYLTAATLHCISASFHDSSLIMDGPVNMQLRQYIGVPAYTLGAGGVPAAPWSSQALSALPLGSSRELSSVHVFHTNAANGFTGGATNTSAHFGTSDLSINSMQIDGTAFWSGNGSRAAQILDNVLTCFTGRVTVATDALEDERAITVPFSVMPSSTTAYTSGLPLAQVRQLDFQLTTTDATQVELGAVAAVTIYLTAGNANFALK